MHQFNPINFNPAYYSLYCLPDDKNDGLMMDLL